MAIEIGHTVELIKKFKGKDGILIPLLQAVQKQYGFVPAQSVDLIAKELKIYPVDIYGVLTFYSQFYLTPRGKHTIRVCQGTACHVMGARTLLEYLSDILKIKDGETTADGLFSFERVACLGCCGMAPVVAVDNDFYGRLTVNKLGEILDKYTIGDKKTGEMA